MKPEDAKSFQDLEQIEQEEVFKYIDRNSELLFGPGYVECERNECIVLVRVKDGTPYLDEFMDHYQKFLKVKHIFFLDTGSTDNTISMLRSYDNISVFETKLPFRIFQNSLSQYLLFRLGKDKWALSVDIDELFDYPFSGSFPFKEFLEYLNNNNYNVVVTQMLDLFSRNDLNRIILSEKDFRKDHIYYDLSCLRKEDYLLPKWKYAIYNVASNPSIKFHMGGIRNLVFNLPNVWLSKHSLTYFSESMTFPHLHLILNARVADISCVIYHYKFLGHFLNYVIDSVEKEYHIDDSYEYKKYLAKLEEVKELSLVQPTSRILQGQEDLLKAEFIVVSDQYLIWITEWFDKNIKSGKQVTNPSVRSLLAFSRQLAGTCIKEHDDKEGLLNRSILELEGLEQKILLFEKQIEDLKHSYSWRLGHRMVRAISWMIPKKSFYKGKKDK